MDDLIALSRGLYADFFAVAFGLPYADMFFSTFTSSTRTLFVSSRRTLSKNVVYYNITWYRSLQNFKFRQYPSIVSLIHIAQTQGKKINLCTLFALKNKKNSYNTDFPCPFETYVGNKLMILLLLCFIEIDITIFLEVYFLRTVPFQL